MTASSAQYPKPKVLIVGAGIGGISLAILLEKAGIPYQVFERTSEMKFLGSAIAITANSMPFLKQIGVYEDFLKIAKQFWSFDQYNERRELEFKMDVHPIFEMAGEHCYVISRPAFHELLMGGIPKDKLLMNKKIVSMSQDDQSVRIECADKSTYQGEILVGADGAYSAVRQALYASLKKENKLPASDEVPLPFTTTCMVGQTVPLDPTEFPELLQPLSSFHHIKGDNKPYSWMTGNTADNRICWVVVEYLERESSKASDSYRSSEWGPEATELWCKQIYEYPITIGADGSQMTMGKMLDKTPKDLISKVMLEEKVFDTWYHGRTVLIGDACHKIHIASGVGTTNAMQDAVVLSNWIAALPHLDDQNMEKIFEEYKKERYPVVMAAYYVGRMFSKVCGTSLTSRLVRFLTKNVPKFMWNFVLKTMIESRPQVWFLKLAEDKGTVRPTDQPSLRKNLAMAATKGLLPKSVLE